MPAHFSSIGTVLAWCICAPAQIPTETKPGLTVGTVMNLDLGDLPPDRIAQGQLPWRLADAQLDLGLKARESAEARLSFQQEESFVRLEQAYGIWGGEQARISAGLQRLPFGLYAGGLIHDPLLQQDAESISPSLMAGWRLGALEWTLAVASDSNWAYHTGTASVPCLASALDHRWQETSLTRLSAKVSSRQQRFGLAMEIHAYQFTLDMEGLIAQGESALADFSALAGLAWSPREDWSVTGRLDVRKPRVAPSWERVLVGGLQHRFASIAYAGAEWLQDLEGEGVLVLRMGLEAEISTLKYFSN